MVRNTDRTCARPISQPLPSMTQTSRLEYCYETPGWYIDCRIEIDREADRQTEGGLSVEGCYLITFPMPHQTYAPFNLQKRVSKSFSTGSNETFNTHFTTWCRPAFLMARSVFDSLQSCVLRPHIIKWMHKIDTFFDCLSPCSIYQFR
jgi:hypothetical protein